MFDDGCEYDDDVIESESELEAAVEHQPVSGCSLLDRK